MRLSIAKSSDDLSAAVLAMSKPAGERFRDDRQVVCPSKVTRS